MTKYDFSYGKKVEEPMVELLDTRILDVRFESYYYDGCETCDYGSAYIQEFCIVFGDKSELTLKTKKMYEYSELSVSDVVFLFTKNIDAIKKMEKDDFIEFLKEWCEHTEEVRNINVYLVGHEDESGSW